MGAEPVNNTLWGVNVNWKTESQWLTNMLDKIPFLHLTQPSHISLTGEFAQLIAGQTKGTQDNASYLDRKSTRLNSSHANISYAVFCLKKKKNKQDKCHVHELSHQ